MFGTHSLLLTQGSSSLMAVRTGGKRPPVQPGRLNCGITVPTVINNCGRDGWVGGRQGLKNNDKNHLIITYLESVSADCAMVLTNHKEL